MKKSIWDNRVLGAAVLALAVLAGVLGIGGAKLNAAAQAAVTYYADNMSADFTARESAAQSLLSIAESAGLDTADAAAALQASQQAQTPSGRYEAGLALATQVGLLYNVLPADTRDAAGSAAQMAWSEFTSRTAILNRAVPAYNQLARDAAEKASGFPASLIAAVCGIHTEEMV